MATAQTNSEDGSEGYDAGQLLYASSKGKLNLVRKLLDSGCSPDTVDYDGRSPVHVAAGNGHLEILKLLRERNAKFNVTDRWGGTPLNDALRNGTPSVVAFVKDQGVSKGKVMARQESASSPPMAIVDKVSPVASFLFACAQGDLALVEDLLTRPGNDRVDLNVADYDKRTGLHLAASEGLLEVVQYLVSKNANVNAVDRWKHTPLAEAIHAGNDEVAEFLRKHGAKEQIDEHDALTTAGGTGGGMLSTKDILVSLQKRGESERWAISDLEIKMQKDPFAKGAAGEIFRAKWRGLDCVAKTWLTATPQMMIDLGNEISLLSTLRHPHLIMFLGACFMHKPPILLMEYCGGGTLEKRLIDGSVKTKLSKNEKIRYTYELALGMNFLHSCSVPVVHRDLKPSNILLNSDGRVKITDFGLSKFIPSKNKHMNDTFAMTGETGSYRFMAPEVFRHEKYSLKVDVYSFALIVFWIHSGVRPLVNFKNPVDAVRAAALKDVRPPVDIIPNVLMRELLVKLWDKDPVNRPTFEDIVDYLETHNLVPGKDSATNNGLKRAGAGEKGGKCTVM